MSVGSSETDGEMKGAPVDRHLRLMGTHVRILIGPAVPGSEQTPEQGADAVEALLRRYEAALSRFRADSDLCVLNADPRATVPASPLLRAALHAALEVAERSGGLVDPTVLADLERAGYVESWDQERRIPLEQALAESREIPRHGASPAAQQRWQEIEIDDAAGTVTRPPGLRIDTGGSGKGHAADLAAELLGDFQDFAIDCGGDVRIGGRSGVPRSVEVEHAFSGEMFDTVTIRRGAVATSGLRSRIWRGEDGRIAHHLLDPSTGEPVFSGLVAVTALAPTAVEAEALAKTALLTGPEQARGVLARHGGITIGEDGRVERIGRLSAAPVVRFTMPPRRQA